MPLDLGPILEHVIQQVMRTLPKDTQTLPLMEHEAMTKERFYHAITTILNTECPQPHCTWSVTYDGVQCTIGEGPYVIGYRTFPIPFPPQGDTPCAAE
jgi:hypothetical protein